MRLLPRFLRVLIGRGYLHADEPTRRLNMVNDQDKPTIVERFGAYLDRIKKPLVRTVRTFFQTAIGVYMAGLVANPAVSDLADITLIDSAVAGGAVATLSLIQNLLEESRQVTYDRG